MNDLSATRLWLMRGAFLLLAMVLLFFQLLPLQTMPRSWAGPNLLICFAFAWALRRPEYVPAPALAVAFFLTDLLLQRPPGLLSLLALLGAENLKARSRGLRDGGFVTEWFTVAVVIAFVLLGYRVILSLLLIDVSRFGLAASELVFTILAYPLVVGVTQWLIGVRQGAPGDLDALGQRL